jgi:hypothetical protein
MGTFPLYICSALDGVCSGSVIVKCSSDAGQRLRGQVSHLLGSSLAATFVRPRLRFWSRFPARSMSQSTGNENDSDGLPACQRLRRSLVPVGEASWPQPLSVSQAPAWRKEGRRSNRAQSSQKALRVEKKSYICHRSVDMSNLYLRESRPFGGDFFLNFYKKRVLFGRGVTKKYKKTIGAFSKKRVLFVSCF